MIAKHAFIHFDRNVRKGDVLDDDDELVVLRPDLFTPNPPTAAPDNTEGA